MIMIITDKNADLKSLVSLVTIALAKLLYIYGVFFFKALVLICFSQYIYLRFVVFRFKL